MLPMLLLGGCRQGGASTPAPATATATATAQSALPQLLAVAACPEVERRVLTLATGSDGIVDAFALVKHCTARPGDGAVAFAGDAWVWVGVDRDLGAVRVRQFVQASLHAELTLGVRASYVASHLELALTPRPGASVSVEPVGALEVSPLDWAGLLAVELAPAAGTSLEWVAKRRLRTETETALAAALAEPIVFAYDARHGESWVVGSSSSQAGLGGAAPGAPRVRVVPRGTALLGPYPEAKSPPDVRLRLESGARIAVRTVCRAHAERLLDNDRRGDVVDTFDWTTVAGASATRPALATPPCPWMLAMRALDEQGAVVSTEVVAAAGDASVRERGRRWVALDALEVVSAGGHAVPVGSDEHAAALPVDLRLFVATDVARRSIVPAAKQKLPVVIELSADEAAWVRAVRPGREGEEPALVGRARLSLDAPRDVDTIVEVEGNGGKVARVHVRARVRETP
jgi:hypothetical protein